MNVTVQDWAELDLRELATATYAIKRAGMRTFGEEAIARIQRWLQEQFSELPRRTVLARLGDELVGWLMLVVQDPTKVEVNPWFLDGHPLVLPGHDQQAVGARLLEAAKNWARQAGLETMELAITRQPDEEARVYDEYNAWYGTLGFAVREESVGMICDLTGHDAADVAIPPDVELEHVLDVDQDELYRCYHDTFQAGQSHFFFDQSEQERRAYFDTFGQTYGIHEATSLALARDGRIVGFSYMIPISETHLHLDWMGIHPDARRQGLGEFLMRLIMNRAAQQGIKSLSLSCDVGNTRAIALYRKTGWQEDEQGIRYALKL